MPPQNMENNVPCDYLNHVHVVGCVPKLFKPSSKTHLGEGSASKEGTEVSSTSCGSNCGQGKGTLEVSSQALCMLASAHNTFAAAEHDISVLAWQDMLTQPSLPLDAPKAAAWPNVTQKVLDSLADARSGILCQ